MKLKVKDRKSTLLYYLVRTDPKFLVRLDEWRIERGLPRRFFVEMLVYLRNTTVAEGRELIDQFIKEKIYSPQKNDDGKGNTPPSAPQPLLLD